MVHGMRQHSRRVAEFLTVQLIALIGWIIVQSTFSLSPLGRTLSFEVTIVVEAIWWIATLVIMFLLFKRVYDRFVQAALDLETADRRLRQSTNELLTNLGGQGGLGENIVKPETE